MRRHEDKPNLLRAALIGAGIGFAVLLGLILLFSKLVETGALAESGMLPAVLASVAAGVLTGSLIAVRSAGAQRLLLTGLLVGFSMFAVIFCAGLVSSYPDVRNLPAMAAVTLLCGPLGALPALLRTHRGRRARRPARR
ncbi:MAG: TIGR04086 family membrane protein [Oscillospiraceae bacterium]|nr:TIGR04086 family membrane protein [Oscillospiraceae bacterium]